MKKRHKKKLENRARALLGMVSPDHHAQALTRLGASYDSKCNQLNHYAKDSKNALTELLGTIYQVQINPSAPCDPSMVKQLNMRYDPYAVSNHRDFLRCMLTDAANQILMTIPPMPDQHVSDYELGGLVEDALARAIMVTDRRRPPAMRSGRFG